jgi:DNA-binding transcriptional ArsR family regulator
MIACSCVDGPIVPHLSEALTVDVAEEFRSLGDPNGLSIVLACLDEARGVDEICETLGLSQFLTSDHLRLLLTVRIMRAPRQGGEPRET